MKLTAKDVMYLEYETIPMDAPVMEAVERIAHGKVRESGYKTISLIVTDPVGGMAGVISMVDILYNLRPPFFNYMEDNAGMDMDDITPYIERFKGLSVRHVMTTQASTAAADEHILVLVDRMVRKKIRRLPVLENGTVIGVVYIHEVFQRLCEDWLGIAV
ncbi:CBS domain-containing protein [Desulfatibacillum aliphaticivorans]|uniref:CBS domain-containing protein n=1 Tax=Desulfatibacillum aliphaticivorans TaxID=218208 RepID=UPI000408248C|nr:CBS domain-containing protein [Desulfatibacillum aliphaticivorans]